MFFFFCQVSFAIRTFFSITVFLSYLTTFLLFSFDWRHFSSLVYRYFLFTLPFFNCLFLCTLRSFWWLCFTLYSMIFYYFGKTDIDMSVLFYYYHLFISRLSFHFTSNMAFKFSFLSHYHLFFHFIFCLRFFFYTIFSFFVLFFPLFFSWQFHFRSLILSIFSCSIPLFLVIIWAFVAFFIIIICSVNSTISLHIFPSTVFCIFFFVYSPFLFALHIFIL